MDASSSVSLARRLRSLPECRVAGGAGGLRVRRAATFRARLLGLAGLRRERAGCGLWLPRTRSVHTFGMRFPLDLVWLDGAGRPVRVDDDVRPGRIRWCREARSVVELVAARPVGKDCGGKGVIP